MNEVLLAGLTSRQQNILAFPQGTIWVDQLRIATGEVSEGPLAP